MRWPWGRRPVDISQSQRALDEARRALTEAKAARGEVRDVAATLHRHKVDNHFTEKIRSVLGGG